MDNSKFPLSEWPKVYQSMGGVGWWWFSLKQPCNQIQVISCVPNTPNKFFSCLGALVGRRDGDTSVIWMVEIAFII